MFDDVHAMAERVRGRLIKLLPVSAACTSGFLALVALMAVPGLAVALLQLGLLAAAMFALRVALLAAIWG